MVLVVEKYEPVTYDFTRHVRVRDHTTWFWRCVGMAFGHFRLGSHNFMVTALGLVCEVALRHVFLCSLTYMANRRSILGKSIHPSFVHSTHDTNMSPKWTLEFECIWSAQKVRNINLYFYTGIARGSQCSVSRVMISSSTNVVEFPEINFYWHTTLCRFIYIYITPWSCQTRHQEKLNLEWLQWCWEIAWAKIL